MSSSSNHGRNFEVVAPIMQKLVNGILQETIDDMPADSDPDDDSPYERTLCAAWDVCTVNEYAVAMASLDFHRVLLKVATATRRRRTRELCMGSLANMACQGVKVIEDMDVLRLCRSILWHENDARVLLETTRLLNALFGPAIRTQEQQIVEHLHLSEFLAPVPMCPSVFHQYTVIVCNTLFSELLLSGLALMTRFAIYASAVDRGYVDKSDALQLMRWGIERLEEEGRDVGIGLGFNRGVAKNVLHLLWALMTYGFVHATDCGQDMLSQLSRAMERLTSYIQEEQDDGFETSSTKEDDQDIQNLANALNCKLSIK